MKDESKLIGFGVGDMHVNARDTHCVVFLAIDSTSIRSEVGSAGSLLTIRFNNAIQRP